MLKRTAIKLVKFLTLFCSAGFLLLLLFPFVTLAFATQQINYQGKLTDSSGMVVADGTYSIEFKLYDDPTAGSVLWTENHTGANEITVTDGLFSVMLGSLTSLSSVDFNQALYLSLNVEADGEMTPRKTLGSVPNSFNALKFDGLASTSVAVLNRANVFTATTTMNNDLIVNGNATTIGYLYVSDALTGFTSLQMSGATANPAYGVALGYQAQATGADSLSMGFNSEASGLRSLAIGGYTSAQGDYSFAVGENAYATGNNAIAIGESDATGDSSIGIGTNTASGYISLALGYNAVANSTNTVAIGYAALASGENATAIGQEASAIGVNSLALGYLSTAEGESATSFMGAQVKTPYTFGVSLDGTTPDIYATSTFYIANGGLTVEGVTTLATTTMTHLIVSGSATTTGNLVVSGTTTSSCFTTDGVTCLTGGSGSSQWTTSGSDIYYATGKVAVGTTTLSASSTLTVQGGADFRPKLTLASSTNLGDTVGALFIQDKYAYVGSKGGMGTAAGQDFIIFDISDPYNPIAVGGVDFTGDTYGTKAMFVRGKYAYMSNFDVDTYALNEDFLVFDVSDPTNPTYIGSLDIPGLTNGPLDIDLNGNYAYLATQGTNNFVIVDISDPTNLSIVGTYEAGGSLYSVEVYNDRYVFASGDPDCNGFGGDQSLIVFDVSNPTAPTPVGGYNSGGSTASFDYDFDIKGRYLYLFAISSSTQEFQILDISSSTNPVYIGGRDLVASGESRIKAYDNYVFLATFANVGDDLLVYNVANPQNVFLVDKFDTSGSGQTYDLAISGRYLYTAGNIGNTLAVYDAGGLSAPSANIGSLLTKDLSVSGSARFANDLMSSGNLFANDFFSSGNLYVSDIYSNEQYINLNSIAVLNSLGSNAGDTNQLNFKELTVNGSDYVGFKAPDSIGSSQVWTLPNADGNINSFLTTDGAGNLSWGSSTIGSTAFLSEVSIIASHHTAQQCTDLPLVEGECRSVTVTGTRKYVNLTNYTQFRIVANQSVAGTATSYLQIEYSLNDGSTWANLEESSTSTDISAYTADVSYGLWGNIVTAAKNDVLLRVVGYGGNGSIDPSFRQLSIQFKGHTGSQWTSEAGGNISYNDGNVGIGTTTPLSKLHIEDGGLLVTGTTTGSTPVSGAGTRLMWIPDKFSFRAGRVAGTEWDDANIGFGSVAFGSDDGFGFYDGPIASGDYSFAQGVDSLASGDYSLTFGFGTVASGTNSFAFGDLSQATRDYSAAFGRSVISSEENAFGFGNFFTNNVVNSFAIGFGQKDFSVSSGAVNVYGNLNVSGTTTSSKFISTGWGSQLGTSTQYWKVEELDLTSSFLGDQGKYAMLSAYSDGNFNNVGAIANNLLIYQKDEGYDFALNFASNDLSSIGQIKYATTTDTFTIGEVVGGSANLTVTGRIVVDTWTADGDTAVYKDDTTGAIGVQASDERLKKNIEPIAGALDIIRSIRGVKFNFKDQPDDSKKVLGVIAQDLLAVVPEAVFNITSPDGETYYGVHYEKIGAILIEAIKEQQTQIESLKTGLLDPSIASSTIKVAGSFWQMDEETGLIKPLAGLNLLDSDIINVRSITSASGNWSIGEDGILVVKNIRAENAIIENGVTVRDQGTGEYSCIYVENGQIKNKEGECQSQEPEDLVADGDNSSGSSNSEPDPIDQTSSSTEPVGPDPVVEEEDPIAESEPESVPAPDPAPPETSE